MSGNDRSTSRAINGSPTPTSWQGSVNSALGNSQAGGWNSSSLSSSRDGCERVPRPLAGGDEDGGDQDDFDGGKRLVAEDGTRSGKKPVRPLRTEPEPGSVLRTMTFWKDGFSVEDGRLMRYDDPTNERILEVINAGDAPPRLFNVLPGQPIEVHVVRRLTELAPSWVPGSGVSGRKQSSAQSSCFCC